jgi:vacuolar-type H+-ATPase subunit E/Vma4
MENSMRKELNEVIQNQKNNFDEKIKNIKLELENERMKDRETIRKLEEIFENSKGMLLRKMEEMLESAKCFSKSLVLEESAMRIQQDKNLLHLIQGGEITNLI